MTLQLVSYLRKGRGLRISSLIPSEVIVDRATGRWYYRNHGGDIGRHTRVLRGQQEGPALVIDADNPDHVARKNDLFRDIQQNQLRP